MGSDTGARGPRLFVGELIESITALTDGAGFGLAIGGRTGLVYLTIDETISC